MSDDLETLTSLIHSTKGRRSTRDLAAETEDRLGRSRWQQLANPNFRLKTSPDPDTVKVMSEALHVPARRIWLAIGRELGHDVDQEESPLIARMPARTSLLTEHQVDSVIQLVAELVALQTALNELQDAREAAAPPKVRQLRAARKTTGAEERGPRGAGGARSRPKGI